MFSQQQQQEEKLATMFTHVHPLTDIPAPWEDSPRQRNSFDFSDTFSQPTPDSMEYQSIYDRPPTMVMCN